VQAQPRGFIVGATEGGMSNRKERDYDLWRDVITDIFFFFRSQNSPPSGFMALCSGPSVLHFFRLNEQKIVRLGFY
jgi:hypothetical protein